MDTAYMTAKQVLWVGLVMQPSSRRTSGVSERVEQPLLPRQADLFLRTAPERFSIAGFGPRLAGVSAPLSRSRRQSVY
jgi:hypothetical protein